MADVIDIDKLEHRSHGTYALMAHFDFVVADGTDKPLFAVEFDGPGHSTTHDARKDELCRTSDLGLFRVDLRTAQVETAKLTFLKYLMHLWFLGAKFEEMRENGEVPADEPFMISAFLRPNARNIFDSEFDLLGAARGKLYRYCKQHSVEGGPHYQFLLSEVLMANEDGSYVAFCSFPIGTKKLYGRNAISLKIPCFGALAGVSFSRLELGQFCTALAIDDLVEEIKLHHNGAGHAVRQQYDVLDDIKTLKRTGYVALLSGYSRDDELAKTVR